MKVKSQVRDITPQMAAELLSKNTKNRVLRPRNVKFLSQQMEDGAWHLTGSGIQIGVSGRILDGQHRLQAVIESGCTVPMFIVSGIDDAAMSVIDTGMNRRANDVLSISGIKNSGAIAGGVKKILAHKRSKTHGGKLHRYEQATNQQVLDFAIENSEFLNEIFNKSQKYYRSFPAVTISGYMAHYHRFYGEDKDRVDQFFMSLASGVGDGIKDPAIVLRNKLMRDKMTAGVLTPKEKDAIITSAWKYYRKGKKINHLTAPYKRKKKSGILADIAV
jgi:hypothetical protein